MREDILLMLEKDGRLNVEEISVLLKKDQAEVAKEIEYMIDNNIIRSYGALINWDKTDREFVTALIEVKVTPQRDQGFDKIAERIYKFDEVKSVYLMSGSFDLTVIIEARNIKEIAHFVSDKLSPLESILSTATHFVLKKYKDHGVVLDKKPSKDERMIVSP